MRNNSKIKPSSSDFFLTYIFDIPNVKTEYRINAIKFALRQIYPGDVNKTRIDFYSTGNKTLCVIIPEERLKNLDEASQYYSPFFLFAKSKKNGIYIFVTKFSTQILLIKNKSPYSITTFFSADDTHQAVQNMLTENKNAEVKVRLFYSRDDEPDDLPFYEEKGYEVFCLEDTFSLRKLQDNLLFRNSNNNGSKSFIGILMIMVLGMLLGLYNYYHYKQNLTLQNRLDNLKKQYNATMLEVRSSNTSSSRDDYSLKAGLPINRFLTDLSQINDNILINSFLISNNSFRVDLEDASALFVLNELKKSEYLSNVILHQSIKTSDGTERFTISGEINDKK